MTVWAQGFEPAGGRYDSAPMCKPGNKPCGKRCIPQNWSCGGVRAAKVAAVAGGVAALAYGGKKLLSKLPRAVAVDPTAAEAAHQNLKDFLNESEPQVRTSGPGAAAPRPRAAAPRPPRAAAPYRGGKSVDYWSPNAEVNDYRRAEAAVGWGVNDFNNSTRKGWGIFNLTAGRKTTPGNANRRRPAPMKRKR